MPIIPLRCRPGKGGRHDAVRKLIAKLLALHVGGTVLVLAALLAVLGPTIHDHEAAQFREQGQRLARTLARDCAGGHVAPAVSAALGTPAVAWVCVTGRDGQPVPRAGAPKLPKPLLRRLASVSSPWSDWPATDGQPALTVFRQPLASGAAFVGMDAATPQRAAEHLERVLALALSLVSLVVFVLVVFLIRRFLTPVGVLTRAARKVERDPQAALELVPVGAKDALGVLASAFNDMLAAIWKHEAQLRLDEAQYRELFENAAYGIWQATPEGRYLNLNPVMGTIFGYDSPEEFIAGRRESGLAYVDTHRHAEYTRLLQSQNGLTNFESQVYRRDGRVIWVCENVRVVRDRRGAFSYLEGMVEDITARKRAEAERGHLANHLRLLLESSGEGIYGIDGQGNCTFINKAGAQMLGYTHNEPLGRNMHALAHHSHDDRSQYPQERSYTFHAVRTGQKYHVDDEVLWRKDGSHFAAEYTAAPIMENGQITGAVVTFVDISVRKAMEIEQKRLLAEALERADHDPLTGLLNHRAFHKRLHEEADRAQRAGAPLAVALLDIDNFKFFNDVYGHKVGDEVLRLVADALRRACRSYDVLARFGGDEFAILMPCQSKETAADLAAHLNTRLAGVSYRLPDDDVTIPLNLSLGVAVFPDEGVSRLEALELADDRLRRAKTGGDEDGYAERVRTGLTQAREGFSMLDALVTAVDNKDRYTRRHSEDVMRYSIQIAQEMGMDEATQQIVEISALIHDVGKIGVPDYILRKPGQLSEEEFAAIKQHPVMGAVIAASVSGFEETLDAVRFHHERWDGKGYPMGLAGDEIPFIARLMAVADSFSAMTTDRPYRKGMNPEKALSILKSGAGVQWDPKCVNAFLRVKEPVKI